MADLRGLSLSAGGLLGGFLQGRRQNYEDDIAAQERKAKADQQQFQNMMAQSNLAELVQQRNLQGMQYQHTLDNETATKAERAAARARDKAALVSHGLSPEDADANLDLGTADDILKPAPKKEPVLLPGGFPQTDAGRAASIAYEGQKATATRAPALPHNIDPLSKEGIAAKIQLDQAVEAAKATKGGTAQGVQVPVADMEARFKEIAGHAKDIASGDFDISGLGGRLLQTREGLAYGISHATAKGEPAAGKSALAGAMDLSGIGSALNPNYQRFSEFMDSQRAMGDDVAKVFKGRQNEDAVIREIVNATIKPEDYKRPQIIKQKLDRLQHVIDLAKLTNPAQAGIGGGPATGGHPFGDLIPKKPPQED